MSAMTPSVEPILRNFSLETSCSQLTSSSLMHSGRASGALRIPDCALSHGARSLGPSIGSGET